MFDIAYLLLHDEPILWLIVILFLSITTCLLICLSSTPRCLMGILVLWLLCPGHKSLLVFYLVLHE